MPYIDYDENGKIIGQFACQQYEEQLYTNLNIVCISVIYPIHCL